MKHWAITFLFSTFFLIAWGQSQQIRPAVTGKVVDCMSKQPIGWASIWSYEEGRARMLKVSYAKPDGSFSWQAYRAGSYKLVFRADGYLTDSLVVTLTKDCIGIYWAYPRCRAPYPSIRRSGGNSRPPVTLPPT